MAGLDGAESIAEYYRRFARLEAEGRSPTYETLALAVAEDRDVLEFLSGLPGDKQQPNLLFAAARHIAGEVPNIDILRAVSTSHADELATVMLERRTQTNEPGRCATLLPAMAMFSGPLAIIEVGASAGLCLNMTRYSYDYGTQRVESEIPGAPTMRCSVLGGEPKLSMPDVVSAAGIDLNPLDPANPSDRAWLECLVWPDQPERAERLSAALDTAVRFPVPVHAGDLLVKLPDVLDQVPPGVTPVIFHSAVLGYLAADARKTFVRLMHDLDVMWVSNEAAGVVVDADPPTYETAPFVLAVNGEPVAFTHPHGAWIDWTG